MKKFDGQNGKKKIGSNHLHAFKSHICVCMYIYNFQTVIQCTLHHYVTEPVKM